LSCSPPARLKIVEGDGADDTDATGGSYGGEDVRGRFEGWSRAVEDRGGGGLRRAMRGSGVGCKRRAQAVAADDDGEGREGTVWHRREEK
jgi:hypothetical protein